MMSNWHETVILNSNTPYEDENHDDNNQTEIKSESIQDQTSVESNTNTNGNTKKIHCKSQVYPTMKFQLNKQQIPPENSNKQI